MATDREPRLAITPRGRLTIGAVAAAVLLLAVAIAVAVGRGGDGAKNTPPADQAARLVPADALVYVHLSTDRGRSATRKAADVADKFPGWPALRDRVVKGLSAPGCRVGRDALAKADEVALALFDTAGQRTANSLVLVDTGADHGKSPQKGCGTLSFTYIGRFLAIGQPESLALAGQLHAGKGQTLADAAGPKHVFSELPDDRVADGWVSAAGVRSLLAPQGGVLGAVGVLFDQAALRGAGFGLSPTDDGAKLVVHSMLDPAIAKKQTSGFKSYKPTLAGEVPASAMSFLGVSNLAPALRRLVGAAGSGTPQLQSLDKLDPALLKLFEGEAAIVLLPAAPAPVLALVAKTDDEAASRRALAKLPAPLKKAFKSGVFDGKVVLSTTAAGLTAMRAGGKRLADTEQWQKSVGNHPDSVSSLIFLDFSRLLSLGEQTGLGDSPAYQAAKGDLAKVRAIGAHTSGNDQESTAEISLLIS